jgi:hypothetical protein
MFSDGLDKFRISPLYQIEFYMNNCEIIRNYYKFAIQVNGMPSVTFY